MDIKINPINQNLVFNAKLTKFSKQNMDRILLPMLRNNAEFSTLVSKSGYTPNAVLNWFINSLGISAAEYYKTKKQEILKAEMKEFHEKKLPLKQVAKHYGKTVKWVYEKYMEFGFRVPRSVVNKRLDNEIPKLISEGYTLDKIAELVNCSETKLRKWVSKHIGRSIVEYRHNNKIAIKHGTGNLELTLVDLMKKCFEAGKTIKETAKILGIVIPKVRRLKDKYGIKSDLDLAHEKMEKFVPKMIEDKLTIKQMSKVTGLSAATIRRWINKVYGKNYINIRMDK
jgi:AraC-like DNA-binding protein